MDRIVTWDIKFKSHREMTWAAMRRRAMEAGVDLPPVVQVSNGDTPILTAFVNHGRWLILCPVCLGLEYARENGLFFCQGCWNAPTRSWLRTTFPSERRGIEALLLKRLNPQNRNWMPSESLADLSRENEAKGV